MKIIFITPSLYMAGGVERVLSSHLNWLASNTNYDITVILTDGVGKELYYPLNERIRTVNLDINFEALWHLNLIKKGLKYIKLQKVYKKKLSNFLIQEKADITVSLLRREIDFICDIKDGSKKIGWLHVNRKNYRNFEHDKSNSTNPIKFLTQISKDLFAKLWMSKLLHELKRLDKFVVLSEEDKNNWPEILHDIPNIIKAIPNPLPWKTNLKSNLTNKKVIAVGRYSYEKGFDLLINAWNIVSNIHKNWELNIYGTGDKSPYIKQIKELHLGKTCHLHDAVKDIISKYQESSIFVLSSRFEGFGMVLIEAMQCGLACVSFDCPCGPRNIIYNMKDGILVNPEDPKELANHICMLIEDESLRNKLSKEAITKSLEYEENSIMKEWISLYENI